MVFLGVCMCVLTRRRRIDVMMQCVKSQEVKPENLRKGGLLLGGLSLQHVLNDLCLLDQESPDNPGPDAAGAPGTAVSPGHALLSLGDGSVLPGAVSLDTAKVAVAVTAFGDGTTLVYVKVTEVTTGSLDDLSASRLGVVRVTLAEGDSFGHLCGAGRSTSGG